MPPLPPPSSSPITMIIRHTLDLSQSATNATTNRKTHAIQHDATTCTTKHHQQSSQAGHIKSEKICLNATSSLRNSTLKMLKKVPSLYLMLSLIFLAFQQSTHSTHCSDAQVLNVTRLSRDATRNINRLRQLITESNDLFHDLYASSESESRKNDVNKLITIMKDARVENATKSFGDLVKKDNKNRTIVFEDTIFLKRALEEIRSKMNTIYDGESKNDPAIHWIIMYNDTTILVVRSASKYYYWQFGQTAGALVIFFMIVVGNISILLRLKSYRRRRSNVNYFIVQLAIADLFVGVFSNTLDSFLRIQKAFIWGLFACRGSKFIQVLFIYSSTNLLVALSIDRWEAVVKPLAFTRNRSRGYHLVAGAWVLACICAAPVVAFTKIKEIDGLPQCWIHLDNLGWRLYMVYLTCLLLVIPTLIIAVCYIHIVYTIWSKGQMVLKQHRSQQAARAPADPATASTATCDAACQRAKSISARNNYNEALLVAKMKKHRRQDKGAPLAPAAECCLAASDAQADRRDSSEKLASRSSGRPNYDDKCDELLTSDDYDDDADADADDQSDATSSLEDTATHRVRVNGARVNNNNNDISSDTSSASSSSDRDKSGHEIVQLAMSKADQPSRSHVLPMESGADNKHDHDHQHDHHLRQRQHLAQCRGLATCVAHSHKAPIAERHDGASGTRLEDKGGTSGRASPSTRLQSHPLTAITTATLIATTTATTTTTTTATTTATSDLIQTPTTLLASDSTRSKAKRRRKLGTKNTNDTLHRAPARARAHSNASNYVTQQHGTGVIPKARIKTIKMTLVIVVAYILCWSPFCILNLCSVFGLIENSTNVSHALMTLTQSLAHLNSAVNPIIFWLFSSKRASNPQSGATIGTTNKTRSILHTSSDKRATLNTGPSHTNQQAASSSVLATNHHTTTTTNANNAVRFQSSFWMVTKRLMCCNYSWCLSMASKQRKFTTDSRMFDTTGTSTAGWTSRRLSSKTDFTAPNSIAVSFE